MKSVMSHSFSQVPRANIPRSSFDRSHGVKTAFDAGYLIPIFVDEALPGDTFNLRTTAMGRMATLLYPLMDNINVDIHYFAVPLRLVWDNFQRMMGEQDNPTDSTDYQIPTINFNTAVAEGDIFDHFGLPPGSQPDNVSALFFRAYNLIWNQWYRDQNILNSVYTTKQDASEDNTNYALLRRGKRHDYFTSCLPWPQKGPAVDIPIGDSAPVTGIGILNPGSSAAKNLIAETDAISLQNWTNAWSEAASPGAGQATFVIQEDPANPGYPNIEADLQSATTATINQLRQSFQVQKMYERDARGGTRYIEIIKSHFGVTSPDMRLQRPEYLGGSSDSVSKHLVASTGWTGTATAPDPIGSLGAFGTFSVQGSGFTKSFVEHSIIIGLASVRADLTYQQGINRMFTRRDRLDFYWPALAQIGEQVVRNEEIYHQGTAIDSAAFGYQERYAEYRYKPSEIHGPFRSSAFGSLDAWHLSQEFSSLPTLSQTFIEENPPIDRVIATPNADHFIVDIYHDLKCARPMPLYGVPGMIDHF